MNGRVAATGAAWVALFTIEFWIAGPFSYIYFGDEGAQAFPYYIYLNKYYEEGSRFLFDVMGGVDAYALFSSGFELLSQEQLLFALLPPWLAVAADKVLTTGLALLCAYLLARRVAPVSREAALLIAILYSICHVGLVLKTLAHNFGYPLMPLGILVFCFPRKDGYRAAEVALVGALLATNVLPVQGGLAFYTALAAAAVVSGAWRRPGFYGAVAYLAAIHLVVWGDTLYAFATMGVLSSRVLEFAPTLGASSLRLFFESGESALGTVLVGLLAAVVVFKDRVAGAKILFLFLFPFAFAIGLDAVPFGALGAGFLDGLNFEYVFDARYPLLPAILAIGFTAFGNRETPGFKPPADWSTKVLVSTVAALIVGTLAFYKAQNLAYWLGFGAVSNLVDVPNLRDRDWMANGNHRTTVVPERFTDNNLLAFGIPTFGGYFQIFPLPKAQFWQAAGGIVSRSGRLAMNFTTRGSCFDPPVLDALADPDFLRIANVRYIASRVPVVHREEARLVSGPDPANFRSFCGMPILEKVSLFVRQRVSPPEMFIYDLGKTVPTVYPAERVVISDHAYDTPGFWAEVKKVGPDSGLVVAADTPAADRGRLRAARSLEVKDWVRKRDALEVAVEAPDGGVLGINLPHLPYWQATVDGKTAEILPANGIHMAIPVEPGASTVHIRYDRWLPSDPITGLLR